MTREDLIKINPSLTEEHISAILNSHHAEVNEEKTKYKNLKATTDELEKATAENQRLQKLVEESGNSSDLQSQIDKLTKANEDAQKTIKNMELKASLLSQGFGAEDVDAYIKATNEGGDIASVLGKMKDNAISAHDKARLEKTPDPQGSGKTPPDNKDTASKLVSQVFGDSSNKGKDILSNYKK